MRINGKKLMLLYGAIEFACGIIVGVNADRLYLLYKMGKKNNKALDDVNKSFKYDKDNPEDVQKIRSMSTGEFVNMTNSFYRNVGRCDMAEEVMSML